MCGVWWVARARARAVRLKARHLYYVCEEKQTRRPPATVEQDRGERAQGQVFRAPATVEQGRGERAQGQGPVPPSQWSRAEVSAPRGRGNGSAFGPGNRRSNGI